MLGFVENEGDTLIRECSGSFVYEEPIPTNRECHVVVGENGGIEVNFVNPYPLHGDWIAFVSILLHA